MNGETEFKVVYMFLACESHDLSQAEKEKNEQIYKMGTIFTLKSKWP